ncbi:uncharacterized protein LOC144658580 [Oculina patagonica]
MMAEEVKGNLFSFDELVSIFGYLSPENLSKCAQVCRDWHEASQVGSLWKRHCFQRWNFCHLGRLKPGERTWQKYFIARNKIETGVATGRPGQDYVCKTLRGHKNQVTDMVFVTTNDIYNEEIIEKNAYPIVASSSQDKTVCLWNVREGKSLWRKQCSESSVACVTMVSHDTLMASGDVEGNIKLWDVNTGQDTALQGSHQAVITSMLCGKNIIGQDTGNPLLIVGFRDGYVKMWDNRITTSSQYELTGPFGLNYLKLRNDHLLATASKFESTIKIFDIRHLTPECWKRPELHTLQHPSDAIVMCLCWVPGKQNRLIAGFNNGDIILWNVDSGQQIHCFQGHRGEVSCVSVLGSTLVSAGHDHTVRLWDLNSLKALQTHTDHVGPVTGLHVDAYRVMSCSRDYSIRTYCWSKAMRSSSSQPENTRALDSKYTLLGGSLQRAGNGFEKVVCDYSTCIGMANDVLKAYSFQV